MLHRIFEVDQAPPSWALAVGALTVAALVALQRKSKRLGSPLPPGPKGLPFLGNIFQIPRDKPWKVYSQWKELYGDMIYLEALGQPILILNSLEDCSELLERRGANYSDRLQSNGVKLSVMDLNEWNWALENYGPRLKEYRRMFHQLLSPKQIPQYRPVIEEEVHTFLQGLLSTPVDFSDHIRIFFGSIIVRIAYGSSDLEYNKLRIAEGEHLINSFVSLLNPGELMVDMIPALRHVPSWMPGAGWKREIARIRALAAKVVNEPYDEAKERLNGAKTEAHLSLVQQLLGKLDTGLNEKEQIEQEKMGRHTAALTFIAGSDTSIALGLGLFAALAMHPEVQLKAAAEIDRVVGHERLPQLGDLDQLPYIRAILKELTRWHIISPVAIPHLSRNDDEYKGYFIPKGTLIMPNSWAILNDPNIFTNPRHFNPDRYLDPEGNLNTKILDPETVAFGYGRRICPGRHLSNESTALMIACLLAVFEVKPMEDENGIPLPLELDTVSDIIAKPLPFQCQIVPRSKRHAALLS
ncbi:cytochrome P450 98A3 [Coprinopsis sp. MPI-PUGE-AT-0042]|nr:cytochrome P450 98A3 [Coprinopsis sp. MPI-PUGE-AT-0042]